MRERAPSSAHIGRPATSPVAPRLQPSSQHRADQRSAQRRPNFAQHLATSGGPPRFNCAASAWQLRDQRASCGRGRADTLGRLMRKGCAMSRAGQGLRRAASAQVARLVCVSDGAPPHTAAARRSFQKFDFSI
ncbi:ribonuclease H protein [Dorcoceras hygrometricum]|uniref:Ribonuclease H protein n=1 Tax=Dorcoceras hygrometricum TaxID=472368 RepID=A0A2Z6ZT23_9LAMI|nr:ribonuclease H protein [Dorcoceras hygrometricum]